jgi:hypothetical protein
MTNPCFVGDEFLINVNDLKKNEGKAQHHLFTTGARWSLKHTIVLLQPVSLPLHWSTGPLVEFTFPIGGNQMTTCCFVRDEFFDNSE